MDVQITLEDSSGPNSTCSTSSSILHSWSLNVPTVTSNVGHQDGGSNSKKPSKAVEDTLQPTDGRGRYLSVSAISSSGGSRNELASLRSVDIRSADSRSAPDVHSNDIESNDSHDIQREASFSRQIAAFCEQLPQEESSQQNKDAKNSLTQIKVHAQQLYLTIKEQEEMQMNELKEFQDKMNEREEHITQLQALLSDRQNEIEDLKRNLEITKSSRFVSSTQGGIGERFTRIEQSKVYTMDEIETQIRTLKMETFKWEEKKTKLDENLRRLLHPSSEIAKLHSVPSPRAELKPKVLCPMPQVLSVKSPRPHRSLNPLKSTSGSVLAANIGATAGDEENGNVETKHVTKIASLQSSIEQLQTQLTNMQQELQAKEREFKELKRTYENHKKSSLKQENIFKIKLREYKDKILTMTRSMELKNVRKI